MLTTFSYFITVSAILLFTYAAYSDLRTLRIPNSICAAVAVLGLFRLFIFWWLGELATAAVFETIIAAVIILLVGMVTFAFRFVGGGDAKLLTATVLLVGSHALFPLIMIMSVFGAILAAMMLGLRYSPLPAYLGSRFAAFAFTTKPMVPYGLAIGVAGSMTLLIQLYLNTVTRGF